MDFTNTGSRHPVKCTVDIRFVYQPEVNIVM